MTLASDLESHSHILFPISDYVGVRVNNQLPVTNGLGQIMVLMHWHYADVHVKYNSVRPTVCEIF